jgi:hypothetical protein
MMSADIDVFSRKEKVDIASKITKCNNCVFHFIYTQEVYLDDDELDNNNLISGKLYGQAVAFYEMLKDNTFVYVPYKFTDTSDDPYLIAKAILYYIKQEYDDVSNFVVIIDGIEGIKQHLEIDKTKKEYLGKGDDYKKLISILKKEIADLKFKESFFFHEKNSIHDAIGLEGISIPFESSIY